jgi:ribonuclease HIII
LRRGDAILMLGTHMPPNTFTAALTPEQAAKLGTLLKESGFEFSSRPYTLYFAQKGKLTVAVYEKGPKVVVQGKDMEEFVRFRLEPEILEEARLGYEEELHPEMYQPHFGVDESGKGDFFGPLVVAGAYVDPSIARALRDLGVMDSKRISSDARIFALAKEIRKIPGVVWDVLSIGPEAYNRLIGKMRSVNRVLAWGHARIIENLLGKRPDCPRSLSDQFGNPDLIRRALLAKGKAIELQQRTKAESDPAVAAASILAREAFVNWMDRKGKELGGVLPRGASAAVLERGRALVAASGPDILEQVAKTHFRTASQIAPERYPAKEFS